MTANTISYPTGTKNLQCGSELPFLIIEDDYTTLMLLENQLINWYVVCYIALLWFYIIDTLHQCYVQSLQFAQILEGHSCFAGHFYSSNNIELFFQDEQLKELHNMIEMEEEGCEAKFKQVFEQLQSGKGPSINYVVPKSVIFDPPTLCSKSS